MTNFHPGTLKAMRRTLEIALMVCACCARAVTPGELAARISRNEPVLLIDVRSATAYSAGHVPGAMNIPLSLLPVKTLPSSSTVVVYGDGLGVVDDERALAIVRSKPGVRGEVLEGGYAGWMAETRLTTAAPGVERERLPGITYDQLVVANKSNMVLVDLRNGASFGTPATDAPRREKLATEAVSPDLLAQFAAKLGIPLVTASDSTAAARVAQSSTTASSGSPARAAAPVATEGPSNRLLVLVADSDSAASEAARQLRASGHYRFTILIGGTEAIQHEGRVGTARMDSDVVPTKTPSRR